MTGLADKLGKITADELSAAAEQAKTAQADIDKQTEMTQLQNQKQTAQVKLETLAGLIEKVYVKPLQQMGLVAFNGRQDMVPVHILPQTAAIAQGFSSEGRYMLPMFMRGGSPGQPPSRSDLDYNDIFTIELGCDIGAGRDKAKISVWLWDGQQKFMKNEIIKCVAPAPVGAVTVKLASEYDLATLQGPLLEGISKWLDAFAKRNPAMSDRLAKALASSEGPGAITVTAAASDGKESALQQTGT
jgi:hypothetical protein